MAKILVIDDDDTVRLSVRLALEDAEHEVDEAPNGAEGLDRLKIQVADLVVTDIFMPEKEGLETIDEIRRDYPQIKIIAISGGGRIDPQDYLEIARQLGADRVLFKPFDIQLLLDVVDELLKGDAGD
jgi:CheY-like chemotaxis protein